MKKKVLFLGAILLVATSVMAQTADKSLPIWGEWYKLTNTTQGTIIVTPVSSNNPRIVANPDGMTLKIDLGQTSYDFTDVDAQYDGEQYFIKAKQNGDTFHFYCKITGDSTAQWRFVEDSTVNYIFTAASKRYKKENLLDQWYGTYETQLIDNGDTLTYSLQFKPQRCTMYRWTGNNGRANNATSCTLVPSQDENSVIIKADDSGTSYTLKKENGKYFLCGNVNPFASGTNSSIEIKKLH
jgi:hypothetical protein